MEIDCFSEIAGTVLLAKELHDIGRHDVVSAFHDTLDCDAWLENTYNAVSTIFADYYSNYDDEYDAETMVFADSCFSDYYRLAYDYGRAHKVSHEDNHFVRDAQQEVSRWLDGCYSMDFKLLGYTKTRKAAKKSKLVVYVGTCDCGCQHHLAFNLVQIYRWFTDKVADFRKSAKASVEREEVLAA